MTIIHIPNSFWERVQAAAVKTVSAAEYDSVRSCNDFYSIDWYPPNAVLLPREIGYRMDWDKRIVAGAH